jgi:hypothetical protein
VTPPDWPQELTHRLRDQHPGLKLNLHRGAGGYVILPLIVVPERSKGLGTAIMTEIIDQADRHGDTLACTPSSDFGGSKKRLEKFYRRFGFVPNVGASKDFTVQDSMIRPPSPAPVQESTTSQREIAELRNLQAATYGSADARQATAQPPGLASGRSQENSLSSVVRNPSAAPAQNSPGR